MTKTIVIVATLDTRGDEVEYLNEIIKKKGHNTIILDAGVLGEPFIEADFSREKVAEAGGKSLKELVEAAKRGADRYEATKVMVRGIRDIVRNLYSTGKLDGIMGIGGSTGVALGTSAMKVLPIGVPKLMVCTFIDPKPVGDEDITMMQTPVDVVGLNRIVKKTLSNAAGAIIGMVEQEMPTAEDRITIGITALGVTTPAVMKVKSRLERRGYETVVFHAKTAILERLIREGKIGGVIDLTTYETIPSVLYPPEIVSKLTWGSSIRKNRLEIAGEKALPQIIAPGGLEMHIFPGTGLDSVPSEFRGRAWSMHGPNVVLVRTNKEELAKIGKNIAERANKAAGPVSIIIPLRGFSEVDKMGAPLYDSEADMAFINTLKRNIKKEVIVKEVDAVINDDKFADEVVKTFDEITAERGREYA